MSTSVFITNFPDSFSAKDLFKTCSQYGYVVDAYIPNKRSKIGKRFGFMRFIKVFNEERLVNNLCTLWVGRYRLYANIVRFQRTPLNKENIHVNKKYEESRSSPPNFTKDNGTTGTKKSYSHAVKGGSHSVNEEVANTSAMVLEDDCLNMQDLTNSLMGRVKEFASLSNLKKVFDNEGFSNIEIVYLGELWVLLKFESEDSKVCFLHNTGVGTRFSKLQQATMELNMEGRITWVEIEGIPLKLWYENTVKCITSRWGVLLQVDDQEDGCLHRKRIRAKEDLGWVPDILEDNEEEDESDGESNEGALKGDDEVLKSYSNFGEDTDVEDVSETKFEDGSLNNNMEEDYVGQKDTHSDDPFNIYELLNKKKEDISKGSSRDCNLKYPPGFTPNEDVDDQNNKNDDFEKMNGDCSHAFSKKGPSDSDDITESICSGQFKRSEIPCTGGSIIHLMDELVKVGQVIGYNMDGCSKNIEEIIRSQGVNKEVCGERKGVWVRNGKNMLIILVYAPQELTEKKMLWDYLTFVIDNWKGDVIVMGDFNEVRKKKERFGSMFNIQGSNAFNMFISKASLEKVPLGSASFTWCHKSAKKMRKLDRFLISESLMSSCPNILAILLDRYLSDHRPILLREMQFDYGPISFRFFHYWFEIEGFDKFVEDTWKEAHVQEVNAVVNLMKKLKFLKQEIRRWHKERKRNTHTSRSSLKQELADLDKIIDNGEGNDQVINNRLNVIKALQDLEKIHSMETAQKAKIKWAIE
ncbi:RNA-directed DNA polymerase, eukaryota, reverse transcriptase zinc-binding domain protein [Tanacetum coccineum]